ncbi:endonuclease/exonuclease/phosphatase family protein [Haloferax elongans ATCC BAA-1513]|uniref:Endonuclease/exonuclease/phosphatase family protein n=1 Tax=Haloferax elongans ATCC BAA-1513 TaxID=1230453 RepID=M0HSX6_HALEO|nr:endonuclease/exonuclease/phosphatase family protein [Haloferax elongans]ELZ87700.1 endonuclease/exonuclease/phosphatase family protein [Haloferax elongans ATCC BAA-1513]
MPSPSDTTPGLTRRTILHAAATVPFAASVTGVARAEPSSGARIATLNLGLGVSLTPVLFAEDATQRRRVVGDLYESVRVSDVPRRMAVLADELAATGADVVALQEAASVAADGIDSVDFLDELTQALDGSDENYRVAAVSETTSVSLPGLIDDEETTVTLRDRDAILVRGGVESTEMPNVTLDATLAVPLGEEGETVEISRGVAAAGVSVSGGPTFAVGSTHLERASSEIRTAQATELAAWADQRDGRVVVAGDVNATPGDEAYDTLASSLKSVTGDVGPTCCRSSDLTSGDLSRTVDHVFVRGFDGTDPTRFVTSDDLRIETPEGERWPSDHAGVVVNLDAVPIETASPSATPTPTVTTQPSPEPTTSSTPTEQPTSSPTDGTSTSADAAGFGILASLVALVVAVVRARQHD